MPRSLAFSKPLPPSPESVRLPATVAVSSSTFDEEPVVSAGLVRSYQEILIWPFAPVPATLVVPPLPEPPPAPPGATPLLPATVVAPALPPLAAPGGAAPSGAPPAPPVLLPVPLGAPPFAAEPAPPPPPEPEPATALPLTLLPPAQDTAPMQLAWVPPTPGAL